MKKFQRLLFASLTLPLLSAGFPSATAATPPADSSTDKVRITYLGHSVFLLSHGAKSLIFDPYLTGNSWQAAAAEDIHPDYILVSHAHQDHLGDTVSIAQRTGATVITTAEIARSLQEQGVTVQAMHIGGKRNFDFGFVRVTPAVHGAGIPGGLAAGFIVNFYGTVIYFAGDTALFGDMALLGQLENIDYALLPIGDNFTMGIDDAVRAVGMLRPKAVIPMHYNTTPLIQQSPEEFKEKAEAKHGLPIYIMRPGETRDLN